MTGYARHKGLRDFAEVRDRMLVSSATAITQQQGHVSGTATQDTIKWMKRGGGFFLFPSAGVS